MRVQPLPWVANSHPHKRQAKVRCVFHWPSRRWSLLKWKGSSIRSPRLGGRRREGKILHSIRKKMKQHFLTLKPIQPLLPWAAVILWLYRAMEAAVPGRNSLSIQGQTATDCQSVYRSNSAQSVPIHLLQWAACQLSAQQSVCGEKIASLILCEVPRSQLKWCLWLVFTSFIHSVCGQVNKNERPGGRRSEEQHQKSITQPRETNLA